MSETIDPRLRDAIKLLRKWMLEAAEAGDPTNRFWPQEQTLQDWFAGALVESKYCPSPTHILAELALGENEPVSKTIRDGIGGGPSTCILYDLVVLNGPAVGISRSFDTIQSPGPGPKLFVQIKSLNSAGTMDRKDLATDLKTLWLAKKHSEDRGCTADTLFLVLATSCKDANHAEHPEEHVRKRVRWLASRFVEFTGGAEPTAVPAGIPFALVLADGVADLDVGLIDVRRTNGTWNRTPPASG